MRRSVAYCRWRASWWAQQSDRLLTVDPHLAEGLIAYATQQMSFENRRAQLWEDKWMAIRSRAQLVWRTQLDGEEQAVQMTELEVDLEEEESVEEWMDDDEDADDVV